LWFGDLGLCLTWSPITPPVQRKATPKIAIGSNKCKPNV
jgi:hypothetical protein